MAENINNRAGLSPASNVLVYRITTDQLRQFVASKVQAYVPGTRTELVVKYCEKKNSFPRASYAILNCAFSDEIVKKQTTDSWYKRVVQETTDVRFEPRVWELIINKYKYDKRELQEIRDSYKRMDEFERKFGIRESQIDEMLHFADPRLVSTAGNESWVYIGIRPNAIIEDMLTDPATGKLPGKLIINEVTSLSNNVVEFTVHIHIGERDVVDNKNVRKILAGAVDDKRMNKIMAWDAR